ncbi:unnamed protein product [Mytilus coruscus]|uniref:Uncharacterized protein n=1 Tax=Mytilus coruscus TaxID=42192 RepID=A0A6J8B8S4_MYTCO|nr:unnamed protein product [Mytilus coruscus]
MEDIKDAKETPGLNRLEYSVQQGYLNTTTVTEEIAFALMYVYVCAPLMQKAKSTKSPLEMNGYYEMTIFVAKLQEWMMARAGKDKLHDHAVEHLPGGQYAQPTQDMFMAARTVGEATNDRIETKRRKIRQERKRRLDESLKEPKLHLCRRKKSVNNMNKTRLLKQVKLWRALAEVQHVYSNDVLKKFNKLSPTKQVLHLKIIIIANKQLLIQEWESSDEESLSNVKGAQKRLFHENDEWSSSDEETLDMACALVHL